MGRGGMVSLNRSSSLKGDLFDGRHGRKADICGGVTRAEADQQQPTFDADYGDHPVGRQKFIDLPLHRRCDKDSPLSLATYGQGHCLPLHLDDQRERPPINAASKFLTKPYRAAAFRYSQEAGFAS